MSTPTQAHEQLAALAHLTEQTRELIKHITQTHASTATLNAITTQLQDINQQLEASVSTERPLAHFNFAMAQSDPQQVLPYSPIVGRYNPLAPPFSTQFNNETQELHATVSCNRSYEGPPHCVHGGVIAGIYDQLLALTAAGVGKAGPTAALTTQFHLPTPLYTDLSFRAWVSQVDGRKITIHGECRVGDNIVSSAQALCIQHRAQ